jgi:molybdate transport system substrate-binding protein
VVHLLLLTLLLLGCEKASEPVRIFAAASTGPALEDFARAYETKHKTKLSLNTGASSGIAQQIVHGAPCDLVLLADNDWMDVLEEKRRIESGTRISLLSNQLVVIAPQAKPFAWDVNSSTALGAAVPGRLALADPEHVPAGKYAKAALLSLGAWDALSKRVLMAPDVRAALLWVERGEVGAGVVYDTDALSSKKVHVVTKLPGHLHGPISYPLAMCRGKQRLAVQEVYRELIGEMGRKTFTARGFKKFPLAPFVKGGI